MCVLHTKIYYVIRLGNGSGAKSWRTRFNSRSVCCSMYTYTPTHTQTGVRYFFFVWERATRTIGRPQKRRENYSEIEYFIILFLRFVTVLDSRLSFQSFAPPNQQAWASLYSPICFYEIFSRLNVYMSPFVNPCGHLRNSFTSVRAQPLHQASFPSHVFFCRTTIPVRGKHLISNRLLSSSFRSQIGFRNLNSSPLALTGKR